MLFNQQATKVWRKQAMTDVFKDIEDVHFRIPNTVFQIPWDKYINDSQGEMVKMLELGKIQCETLQKSLNWSAFPETLAWMVLWTRNFNLIQSVISILDCDLGIEKAGQVFTLRILWRLAFELMVTLDFILSESADLIKKGPHPEKKTFAQRLCGYLAWCLWNDKEFDHKMTQGWRLDALFGKGEVMTTENKNQLNKMIEIFWGDENAIDPAMDKDKKRNIREDSLNNRSRLLRWLSHKKLFNFREQLQNQRPSNYFELIDPDYKSLSMLLSSSWNDAGYPAYQDASALIHGSTFKGHMELIAEHLFPGIAASDEEVQRKASHVRRYCNFNSITLQLIQGKMIGDGLVN